MFIVLNLPAFLLNNLFNYQNFFKSLLIWKTYYYVLEKDFLVLFCKVFKIELIKVLKYTKLVLLNFFYFVSCLRCNLNLRDKSDFSKFELKHKNLSC